jgi:hypothetical protein
MASNDRMINELERIWDEAVMAKFEAPYRTLPRVPEESHERPVRIAAALQAEI